jgi:hypothetical protein
MNDDGAASDAGSDDVEPDNARDAAAPLADASMHVATPDAGSFSRYIVFRNASTGFETNRVYDSDRETIRFDVVQEAMVRESDGLSIPGWTVNGKELNWTSSGVEFEVAFGSEDGEPRAYFTEVASKTICNLVFTPPNILSIFATSEKPPQD